MKNFRQTQRLATLAVAGLMLFSCSSDDDTNPIDDDPIVELPPIVLDCDYFSEDRVLTDDPQRPVDYVITCYANVQGSLKIEPGVVIEFENHAGLRVSLNSKVFEIKGTATNLTESSPIYEGSLAIRGVSGTTPQALHLNHVEIKNGGSIGLDYHGLRKNATVSVSNVTITGNEGVPVKVSAEMAHIFNNTSSYAGNASDFFNITPSYYEIEDQTVTWQKLNVPYLVDDRVHIKHNGHLTIEAGAEIQFKPEGYIQPYDGSTDAGNELSLKIQGTADNPVHLKAYNSTNWGGIMFGFTQENNVINHAIIENAKGDFPVGNHQNTGAIYLHASPKLTVSNTTFKDLQNCTFYALYDDYFENLIVTDITYDNVGAEYCTP